MKKLSLLAFSCLTLLHCTVSSEPDFLKLDDYKIITLNKKEIKLGTNAYFFNPNDVGCEVVKTEVKLLVNGLYVSTINQSNIISLDADIEFIMPMKVTVPIEKISKDKGGILGGLLSTLLNQNISIKYDGIVRLRKAGIEFDIEIIKEEMLKEFKRN